MATSGRRTTMRIKDSKQDSSIIKFCFGSTTGTDR
jgi:hypothetical protein